MPAWYDILSMDGSRHIDVSQIEYSAGCVHDLIKREVERGVHPSRILLAGFSQGGAVAYQAALTYPDRLAGIVALSTYFPTEKSIEVDHVQAKLPILICHGSLDPVVPESLGLAAKEALERRKFQPEYKCYPMEHQVCPEEVIDINDFFKKILS
jgi:phospholipase/carboxylesterase